MDTTTRPIFILPSTRTEVTPNSQANLSGQLGGQGLQRPPSGKCDTTCTEATAGGPGSEAENLHQDFIFENGYEAELGLHDSIFCAGIRA